MTDKTNYCLHKNENFFGHYSGFNQILKQTNSTILNQYSTDFNSDLYSALAKFHHISPNNLFIDNGLESAIKILLLNTHLESISKIFLMEYSWSYYHQLSSQCFFDSDNIIEYSGNPENLDIDYANLKKTLDSNSKPGLIVITRPNNPTGLSTDINKLEKIIKQFKQYYFFIDEAYIGLDSEDFKNTATIDLALRYPNVVLGRSFSKYFGVPGLRLGYLIANSDTITNFNLYPLYLGISPLTEKISINLIKNYKFYQNRAKKIQQIRQQFITQINQVPHLQSYPSQANFILIKVDCPYSQTKLSQFLKKHGYLIKIMSTKDLNGYLRITLAPPEILDPLYKLLKTYFSFS